jgi:polar amino acid transport system substrate-binding protein
MKKAVLVFVLILSAVPLSAQDAMKLVYFNDFPPFSWEDGNGRIQGILVDVLSEAIEKRMGIPVSHSGHPWVEAQEMVKNGGADAFSTVPTPERREYAEVSKEPLITAANRMFVFMGNPKIEAIRRVRQVSDLKPFELMDYLGNGWARENLSDFHVKWLPTIDKVLLELAKGEGDLFVQVSPVARYKIEELGLKDEIIEMPTALDSASFFLCVGKKSTHLNILKGFDEAIRQMRGEGKLQEIFDKYTE